MKYVKSLITLIILLFWSISSFASELPDPGEISETFISREKKRQLGKEFMKMVHQHFHILKDPIINDYIQKLGDKLASNANTKRKKFNFFVVNDPTINAFAGPDAFIGINSGTITSQLSESTLAAIMAHETAHVTQHHIERIIKRAENTQMAAAAGMLAAFILGATTNNKSLGNVATGATMASMGGATQHMISFTKEHEIEADNIGMKILYKSGFDPNAMPDAFLHMQRLRHDYSNDIPRFLLTHPVTSDRIAEAKNRASQYKFKKTPTKTNNTFSLIQIRTEAITSKNLAKLIRELQLKIKSKKQKDKIPLKYGLALAFYKSLEFTKSKKTITPLLKKYPKEILFQMLAADIEVANKRKNKAITRLKMALASNKNYYPLIIQYTETLVRAKQAKEAISFIKTKIRSYPNNSMLYFLLSQAYNQNQQKVDAHLARAKAYEIEDYKQQALVLLQQAAKIPKLSRNNHAIINARIHQLKQYRGKL